VVSTTPRPLYPRKDPVPIVQAAGWAAWSLWTGAGNLAPTGYSFINALYLISLNKQQRSFTVKPVILQAISYGSTSGKLGPNVVTPQTKHSQYVQILAYFTVVPGAMVLDPRTVQPVVSRYTD
jgi:hypothetical protein